MSAFSGRVTLFDVLNISCASIICSFYMCKHRQTYQQAGWFLRPDCVPSSECPQFGSAEWCGRNISGSTHLSSTAAARCHAASTAAACYDRREVAGMVNFKMCLLRQFCSNWVKFFLQYTGDTDAKKMMDQNFEIQILWFLRIFEIFKKVSRGPSGADLDHYGCSQTRSD